MKKTAGLAVLLVFFTAASLFAEATAKSITEQASKKSNVDDAIIFLKSQVEKIADPAEKRSVYIFMASLQEQMSFYNDAQISYARAASIAAMDAEGMPKKSNEQLVLDAVRCALSAGDSDTADTYLNSAVRNSKNAGIRAYIKLYSQWSKLCRAESSEDLQEPVLILQSYLKSESMLCVQPALLLTLWYLTGEKSYGLEILGKYPRSMEAAVVNGDAQLLPTPFWFFVPKKGEAEQGTGSYAAVELPKDEENADANGAISLPAAARTEASDKTASGAKSFEDGKKYSKLQLGLFRTQSNAESLSKEVNKKGFNSYVTAETRSSGTTYYLVLINDGEGNLSDRLRSSGYECYVVE